MFGFNAARLTLPMVLVISASVGQDPLVKIPHFMLVSELRTFYHLTNLHNTQDVLNALFLL